MNAMLEVLAENLPLIVSGVIVPLVSWYIKKKIDNERLSQALVGINEAVLSGVGKTAQTYVREIKKSRADGKLTAAEKQEAKRKAMITAKALIQPKLCKEARKLFGDLDTVLSARIERALAEKKEQ